MDGRSKGNTLILHHGPPKRITFSATFQGAMRKAATIAGIIDSESSDRLQLVLEPEAACVACEQEKASLQKGNNFMVLDCGGGTVDITMHRVAEKEPSLKLVEIAAPAGGAFGSAYVDLEFEKFLKDLTGADAFSRFKPSREWVALMRTWEGVKLGFDGVESAGPQGIKHINIGPILEVIPPPSYGHP